MQPLTFEPAGHTHFLGIRMWSEQPLPNAVQIYPPIPAIVITGIFTRNLLCLNLPGTVMSSPHSPLCNTDFSNTWK